MVTKEQAVAAGNAWGRVYFHYTGLNSRGLMTNQCRVEVGPRGGRRTRVVEVRTNGACKTWKTRPNEFRLPIKYGLKMCDYITEANADWFHPADECTPVEVKVDRIA